MKRKMNSIFEMFMSKVGMLKNTLSFYLATRPKTKLSSKASSQGDSDDDNPILHIIARQLFKAHLRIASLPT